MVIASLSLSSWSLLSPMWLTSLSPAGPKRRPPAWCWWLERTEKKKKKKKMVAMKTTMAAAAVKLAVLVLVLAAGEAAAREGREQPGLCRRRPVGRCLAVPAWGCRVAAASAAVAAADVASSASSSAAAAPGTGPSGARGWAAGPACWPARRSTTRPGQAAHTSGTAARCDTVHKYNKNESIAFFFFCCLPLLLPNGCNHPLNAFIQLK